MIDLHLHLDGSLTADDILFLAENQKIKLPYHYMHELEEKISAPPNCQNLNQYLQAFELPLSVLQNEEAVAYSVSSLLARLHQQGLRYAEIRFAPQLHTRHGTSQYEIVQAAVNAMKQALSIYQNKLHANLILCCMRGDDNEKENRKTIEIVKDFLGRGVCAVDLAGAEGNYKTSSFQEIFQYAKALDVPFTVHAGEADGPESVWFALKMGASRIGHGVRSVFDSKLLDYLREHQIPLELCFTSNLQTKAVASADEFPLPVFLQNDICATINTDNMTVSKTTLQQEFEILQKQFDLSPAQLKKLHKNAIEAAFLSYTEKEILLCELDNK